MLINSDHTRWVAATAGVTAAATAAYLYSASSSPYGPSGGSGPGVAFGVVGTTCMVVAGFLSVRKRRVTWRMGSAQLWMKLHIWLGILAVPFILFHSGFRWGGPLTSILMVLFYVVIGSGLFGLILQQFVPAMMTARVPLETVHSQIDHVLTGLAVNAYELVASLSGALSQAAEEQAALAAEEALQKARPGDWKFVRRLPAAESPGPGTAALQAFYLSEVRPYLRRARGATVAPPDFTKIRLEALPEWRQALDALSAICDESRQLAVQQRLHTWLHGWLLLHAPLSFALFVLAALHIVYALQY